MARAHPLIDLLQGPWAIVPEKLDELRVIYAAHMRGDVPDIEAIEARLGRPLASEQQTYTVDTDGVATLVVDGVMAPKMNLLMQVSGGTSTQLLTAQFDSMANDGRVRSAVIVWDSPGGNVQGVPAAAAALRQLAEAKPTVSLVRGAMASAAYWVGSAANAVLLEGPTDIAGSLGVVQRIEWDQAEPNATEIVRGKYKRAGVNGRPPSAEYMADAEARVDYIYGELIDAVAQHRGVDADTVLQHMADGRVFVGRQAVQAGLADGFATLGEITQRLATSPATYARRRKARIGAEAPPSEGAPTTMGTETPPAALTRDTLQRDHPDLFAALRTEFTAAGATAERERIQAVRAQALPGHEALIEQLAWDGKTTGPEAAVAVLAAERALAAGRLQAIAADAPPPLDAAATGAAEAAQREAAAAQSEAAAKTPMQQALELSAAIAKKQADAQAAGRTLSAVDALALIRKETTHG